MAAPAKSKADRRLRPANTLLFVSGAKVTELSREAISTESVGQKAFGLACLPRGWTLPFLAISHELFSHYTSAATGRRELLTEWVNAITVGANRVGIDAGDEILVRSSGSNEDIASRGKLYSSMGVLSKLELALADCLEKLANDKDVCSQKIPLVIQKRCQPEKAKGHLSNERRCYEEHRDWMGEIDSADATTASYFPINLRHWRQSPPERLPPKLSCSLSTHISEALKAAAEWAYRPRARVHFEWVWDGTHVFLVQADEECTWQGHDPAQEHHERSYHAITFTPKCLRRVQADDVAAARFAKIANVLTYLKLGMPTAPLYIVDNQETIRQLGNNEVPEELRADISEMVKGSLVIRTDLATSDQRARQLLPRTQEVREPEEALRWLKEQSAVLSQVGHEGAFIFHNFIPALSAAFAYADPNDPLVQIESLWGLPEGLYYNSHDKYVVDTLKAEIDSVPAELLSKFSVREKRNFKHFFVSTTPSGRWETLTLKPPYDWKGSLSEQDCRRIAYESRRIAKSDGYAVSIMWFIGVPPSVAERSAIPWYHERFDITATRPTVATRAKTPFDKFYVVRCANDLEEIRKGLTATTTVPRIRVQPTDEKLLRDKNTLKRIGELAKLSGAIIVLEGAVLSHAYYQLLSTGAVVEVVHPFIGFEERHGFNKLVRDGVPDLVRQRGESVTIAELDKEALVSALRQKLVEEAYELMDARDLGSVVGELADVREVIDTLIEKLEISEEQVSSEQTKKRKERGGFSKGIVLVETHNAPPTSKQPREVQEHLQGLLPIANPPKVLDEVEFRQRSEELEKRTDRREATGKVEIKASVVVPVTRKTLLVANTIEERVRGAGGKVITGSIRGVRNGPHWSLEISVNIDETQPEMPFE